MWGKTTSLNVNFKQRQIPSFFYFKYKYHLTGFKPVFFAPPQFSKRFWHYN